MNDEHRANLKRLADYLDSLPEDYSHFAMELFTNIPGEREYQYVTQNGGLEKYGCLTVACAVGHGPAAGILATDGDVDIEFTWSRYCTRVFGVSSGLDFTWLFDAEWRWIDNTHYGAAARIRHFLQEGIPGDFIFPERYDPESYSRYRKKEVKA